eukprot:g16281.t1
MLEDPVHTRAQARWALLQELVDRVRNPEKRLDRFHLREILDLLQLPNLLDIYMVHRASGPESPDVNWDSFAPDMKDYLKQALRSRTQNTGSRKTAKSEVIFLPLMLLVKGRMRKVFGNGDHWACIGVDVRNMKIELFDSCADAGFADLQSGTFSSAALLGEIMKYARQAEARRFLEEEEAAAADATCSSSSSKEENFPLGSGSGTPGTEGAGGGKPNNKRASSAPAGGWRSMVEKRSVLLINSAQRRRNDEEAVERAFRARNADLQAKGEKLQDEALYSPFRRACTPRTGVNKPFVAVPTADTPPSEEAFAVVHKPLSDMYEVGEKTVLPEPRATAPQEAGIDSASMTSSTIIVPTPTARSYVASPLRAFLHTRNLLHFCDQQRALLSTVASRLLRHGKNYCRPSQFVDCSISSSGIIPPRPSLLGGVSGSSSLVGSFAAAHNACEHHYRNLYTEEVVQRLRTLLLEAYVEEEEEWCRQQSHYPAYAATNPDSGPARTATSPVIVNRSPPAAAASAEPGVTLGTASGVSVEVEENELPLQHDGVNCGFFVLHYMLHRNEFPSFASYLDSILERTALARVAACEEHVICSVLADEEFGGGGMNHAGEGGGSSGINSASASPSPAAGTAATSGLVTPASGGNKTSTVGTPRSSEVSGSSTSTPGGGRRQRVRIVLREFTEMSVAEEVYEDVSSDDEDGLGFREGADVMSANYFRDEVARSAGRRRTRRDQEPLATAAPSHITSAPGGMQGVKNRFVVSSVVDEPGLLHKLNSGMVERWRQELADDLQKIGADICEAILLQQT